MNIEHEIRQKPEPLSNPLLKQFEKMSLKERIIRIASGLKQDHESGIYKWAHFELQRTWSWLSSLLVPILAILLIILCSQTNVTNETILDATFLTPEPPVEILDPLPDVDKSVVEPPPDMIVLSQDIANSIPAIDSTVAADQTSADQIAPTENTTALEVTKTLCSVTLNMPIGARTGPARSTILSDYRDSAATEKAVLNALRWLKREQKNDGSWDGHSRAAVTALATLTFLAHGETPSSTNGFETTVKNAIQWLCNNQEESGHFKNRDPHDYAHPICTYALCEAYTMTKIPEIKSAAGKALKIILDGQHPTGGWDYNCQQSERNDTSYMGWCVQALKAAHMAGIGAPDETKKAMRSAILALKRNSNNAGWFGYVNNQPAHTGLSGAGILSLQLMGSIADREVKNGIDWCTKNLSFDWDKPEQPRPLYVWYYLTQAYFHEGGRNWNNWNSLFSKTLAGKQNIIRGASADGKDIGFWETPGPSEKEYGRVYDTTLCALMLQVYYRYLPTYAKISTTDTAKSLDYDKALVEVTIRQR